MSSIRNKGLKAAGIALVVLLLAYFGIRYYFTDRYYYGTHINGIDVSFKTLAESEALLKSEIENYVLEIKGIDVASETITAADVGLELKSENKLLELKADQNASSWFLSLFSAQHLNLNDVVVYDDAKLSNRIADLECLDPGNVIEPKSAYIEFEGGAFKIVPEVTGNRLDEDKLREAIKEAVNSEAGSIDLDEKGLYDKPAYTSESPEVKAALEVAGKYASTSITYERSGEDIVADAALISQWVNIDENFKVSIDEAKVSQFVDELAGKYNTYKTPRSFKTSLGTTVTISRGDYGWRINSQAEKDVILKAVADGQKIVREPDYLQKAASHGAADYGSTYLEISLSAQHAWFYKNGVLIAHGDVVTGDVENGTTTPTGIYRLKYKDKDATLRGEDYESDVAYWMPFNGDVGFHDASWRSKFGGDIYLTNGSHGCVNAPYSLAQAVFNNISAGNAVIVYR
ncbi:L,D-transpeptidase family protein [Youngiibacter multivorans]|uniref:Lipoprotein-anchoring transpeptidase ErfK/SrfK n=1 Tax=Youngiibacter multivorans TaxID=937251 RepID=A0ABS4G884_9CLOT|nr:L,D-transpeptidase/peptidoglycan binding protein [Youngiibacter multivorans]MBP1920752.1 lipoprotein-anchoring transpeptidase ErfK/SrfK [Youngiibacter multivorans]